MRRLLIATAVAALATSAAAGNNDGGNATAVAGAAASASATGVGIAKQSQGQQQGQLQGQQQGQIANAQQGQSSRNTVRNTIEGSVTAPSISGGNGCSWGPSIGIPGTGAVGGMFGRVKCDEDRRAQILINAGRPDLAVLYLIEKDSALSSATTPNVSSKAPATRPQPRPTVRLTRCELDANGAVRVGVPAGTPEADKATAASACVARLR